MWGYGPYGGMMGYGDGWSMGWMMIFGGFFWLVVLVLAIAAVAYITRTSSRADGHRPGWEQRSSGLDILEERYARGEINRDEYLQKKRDILGRSAVG